MNHLMIDLETLAVDPTCVILSIGAVVFTEEGLTGREFYHNCLVLGQSEAGRTTSERTLRWWLQQSDAARAALNDPEPVSLSLALRNLADFYLSAGCERVWANGLTFDIAALEDAYRTTADASNPPWAYNAPRDMRLLRDLAPRIFAEMPPNERAHNALDDARWQARFTVAALKDLS